MNIGNEEIRGFLIKYSDGSESIIGCQQVSLETPFVSFWRLNGPWTSEAFVTAVNVRAIAAITPIYKDGTRSAELFSKAAAEQRALEAAQ